MSQSQSTATRSFAATVESVVLLLDPHGGQRIARRNALRALHADSSAARGRRHATVELQSTPVATPDAASTHRGLTAGL